MKIIIAILALLAVAMCAEVGTVTLNKNFINLAATFHYEDPFTSTHSAYCTGSREEVRSYEGLDGYFMCAPETFGRENKCYQDYPASTTATPMPLFADQDDKAQIRCVLVCGGTATGNCGPRAECMVLPGLAQAQVSVCMYKQK